MARRVYVQKFIDVDGNYIHIESEKPLKEFEWQVKENKHNIDILNKKYTELEVKYLKFKKDK